MPKNNLKDNQLAVERFELLLRLESFDFKYLEDVTLTMEKTVKKFFMSKSLSVSKSILPKKSSLITVLKSPHVSKKSREQFLKKEYIFLMVFKSTDKKIFNFLVYFINQVVKKLNCSYTAKVSTKQL